MNTLSQPYNKFGASQLPQLINLGLNFASGFIHGGGGGSTACRAPQGCFQCRMTGRGDIAGCLDQLLVPLYAQLTPDRKIPNAQVYQAYQTALAAISNDAYFDQRSTYQYLADAKTVLTNLINQYVASGGSTTATNTTGATSTVNIGGSDLPTSYLILGGAGIVGLILLLKSRK